MITRTNRTTSSFARPFRLRGVDRVLPAGNYDIVTVSTVIFVPGRSASSIEMATIDPRDLAAAQGEDANRQDEEEPPCPS